MRSRVIAVLAMLAAVAASLSGQQPATTAPSRPTPCTLVAQPSTRLSVETLAGGGQVVFMGGGVLLKCPARNITLRGDSAEQYPNRDFMIGNVKYDEPRLHLTSDVLNHFSTEERVVAVGNVHANLPNGSTLVGPIAEWKRAVPKIRPRDQLLAQSRPTITIVEKDSTGKPVPPTTVVAENVFMDGDSLIYAGGQVVITRPEITATADSVFLDQTRETMRLMREPMLKGKKERPYTLTGDLIDVYSKNKKLQRIISRANAKAVSDSMTLKSDTIDLRVKNDVLDHAYAWGAKSRARVESPSQNLLADSLDVFMPGQHIQRVRALRRAYAEGAPDTTRFRAEKGEKDWMRGDTIVAHFDSTSNDTTKKGADVKQITATGRASSFYHLAPSDSGVKRPAINYVLARVINVDFDKSRVATVTTIDSVSGVYVEPRADTSAVRANNNGRGVAPGQQPKPSQPLPKSIIPLPPKKP